MSCCHSPACMEAEEPKGNHKFKRLEKHHLHQHSKPPTCAVKLFPRADPTNSTPPAIVLPSLQQMNKPGSIRAITCMEISSGRACLAVQQNEDILETFRGVTQFCYSFPHAHTPSLQSLWELLCVDHHWAVQTVLFGRKNHSGDSWWSILVCTRGRVCSSLLLLLLSQPPVQPEIRGSLGKLGLDSKDLKEFGATDLSRQFPLSYSNPLFISACCKPGSPTSRAGISGSNHCPTASHNSYTPLSKQLRGKPV